VIVMTTTPPDLPPAHTDLPQDKRALKANKSAAWVRKTFPRGTRVEATRSWDEAGNGCIGTVIFHVPSMTADGGRVAVLWDDPNPFGGGRWISRAMWAGGLLIVDPATGRGTVRESMTEFFRRQRNTGRGAK